MWQLCGTYLGKKEGNKGKNHFLQKKVANNKSSTQKQEGVTKHMY